MTSLLLEALVFLGLATTLIVDGALNADHRLQDAATLVVVVLVVELRWRMHKSKTRKFIVKAPDAKSFRRPLHKES